MTLLLLLKHGKKEENTVCCTSILEELDTDSLLVTLDVDVYGDVTDITILTFKFMSFSYMGLPLCRLIQVTWYMISKLHQIVMISRYFFRFNCQLVICQHRKIPGSGFVLKHSLLFQVKNSKLS